MNLKTICKWLSMSEFELFLNLNGLLIFSILLCLKIDGYVSFLTWFHVFLPLFIVDIMQANFIMIVFIHEYLKKMQFKTAFFESVLPSICLFTRFILKMLIYFLIMKSSMDQEIIAAKYQLISIPIYFNLIMLLFRSCSLKVFKIYS
jgi:ribonuclease P/MRP protein subunit RPP20